MLAAIFGAVDVGLAYWMLGYLPVQPSVRRLTALFFGLGTALFYTSAIGTTWFWAHVVAVGCLLLAIGLALSADRAASEPRRTGGRPRACRAGPDGWYSAACLVSLGALTVALVPLAGAGAPAWAVAGARPAGSPRGGERWPSPSPAGFDRSCRMSSLRAWCSASRAPFCSRPGRPGPSRFVSLAVGVAAMALAVTSSWRASPWLDAAADRPWRALSRPEARQVAAGLLFGLACCARLTILVGFPFLLLVGGGTSKGRCFHWR